MDYFLLLPGSGGVALHESITSVMKHSLHTERRHYNERPMSEKKVRVYVVSNEDDSFVGVLPSNGELVTSVAADSTISVPSMFIGKTLRYSEDHKTVFLAHFQEVKPCKFKLNAGKSYRECEIDCLSGGHRVSVCQWSLRATNAKVKHPQTS